MVERISGIVILAGGTALRLGGVSKPDFNVGGKRLIDILFNQLDVLGLTGQRVVVAPSDVDVPPGVKLTLEDPPRGGPLAGIGAGLAALDFGEDDLIALATCDAPLAVRLLPRLARTLTNQRPSRTNIANQYDGVVPVNAQNWPLYTHGLYRGQALQSLSFTRNGSVRREFETLKLAQIIDDNLCIDVDEAADAQALLARLKNLQ
ncbi:molybdopterin-guanine dinucleotide biosynthesis protein A [Trueperella bonasi]|uniref:Molybdopterin-guanine dinucleotide biosynthesis protein A n=1 Tax=Trueperella bonasi TaxID=312286 RepID=A0ABT9NFT0_9ACTO|nr:NTP transferase domain-containing protein [Trueperella bonasi]MDP9806258.1 molybdopterin-guanine dinucleotide biosynthesis protein A [Trueperella bonasi]